MKTMREILTEGTVKKQTVTLYHGVRDPKTLKSILDGGFDLKYVKPRWENDYAVSALMSKKAVSKYMKAEMPILKFKVKGNVWKSEGQFDSLASDLGIMASDPVDFNRKVLKAGVDAAILGGGLVYVYNVKAISGIEVA
jgi:hypothetical protein